MKGAKLLPDQIKWEPAVAIFGDRILQDGQPLVEFKTLSDRRPEGAGAAYFIRFNPPDGKLLKIVATARSDEHVYLVEGAYCNRAGEPIASPGAYGLNAAGRHHSAFTAVQTTALVVYRGEPDEVHELKVVDPVIPGE
jgi:hypothetical protein